LTTSSTDEEGTRTGPQVRASDAATERLTDQLAWYDRKSVSAQRAYKRVKALELVVAAIVPMLAGLSAPAALTASLAVVVVIAEGMLQLNQWQTTWVLYRGTAEALKHEKYLHLSEAGPYAGPDRDRVLAERVEGLVSQEHAKWTEARSRREDQDAEHRAQ
jgi:hypothetical protein